MMLEMKTVDFMEKLASKDPVPGGGGASAAVGALAAALGRMVSNLTIGKKKYADVEAEVIEINQQLEGLQKELIWLVDQDAEAFMPLSKAYSLPKGTEEERCEKERVLEEALDGASVVPLRMMEAILKVMGLLAELAEKGSKLAMSDVGVGILFGQAALEGASLNVMINAGMMKDQKRAEELTGRVSSLIEEGSVLKEKTYQRVLEQI